MPPGYTHTVFGFGSFLDWRPTSFANTIPASRVCSACGLVPSTAALLPCLHRLCPSCLERSANSGCGGECPVDKQGFQSEDVVWTAFEKDALLNRQIHCWNADHGCDAVGAAPEVLEHFNHRCQYHVVSCPSCGQDVAHTDITSHLDCETCLVASDESRKAQDRYSNVNVVPAESIETFENTLKDNSEIGRTMLAKIGEVHAALVFNASAIEQSQEEIKTQLREMEEKLLNVCEDKTREMTAVLVSINSDRTSGSGSVGNTLLKVEALIDGYKTEGATSARALVGMKEEIKDKLNNLELASKEIFLELRRESEPLEWTITDWSKLKEKARGEVKAYCEAENASYFCGYSIVPGVRMESFLNSHLLRMTVRVCKGAYDHLLPWPIRESFCLKFVQPSGQCFKDYLELDTRFRRVQAYDRPTTPQNDFDWSNPCIRVSKIEEAGCINDDKLRVRFAVK